MINKNSLFISILIYLSISVVVIYLKPEFIFADKNKKKLKVFGTGKKKNKTIFPLWFILFVLAILIYFVVCCVVQKIESNQI